jgi:hypothetical protein
VTALDLNKITSSAVEGYLEGAKPSSNGHEAARQRRLGSGAAVAVGVGLAVAARAAYKRIRGFDLERAARAMEGRLKH